MNNSYRALTRAYRPQSFDDIVSQEHVSNTLKNAIAQNRLGHAYLFCGPRGVGKTTMARVLARSINHVDPDIDAEHLNNTLNIIEIDAASNNSVDDVRALRERVRIPPQSGRYKVYIIDEVHMLSKQAFNALLKTLEEPPAHALFIFATTEPQRILPTILSRCQRFDFRRITAEEIVGRLKQIAQKEKIQIDDESLHVIAKRADGSLRDALGILDQAIAFCGTSIGYEDLHRSLNLVSAEQMFELTDTLIRKDASAGMLLLHDLLQSGNDIMEFLRALTEHLRNLYLSKDSRNIPLIEATTETAGKLRETGNSFSTDDLMRMLHIVHEARFSIRHAQQPRIHLEITLLRLYHMTRTEGLKELLATLRNLDSASEKTIKKDNTAANRNTGPAPAQRKRQASTPDKNMTPVPVKKTSGNSGSTAELPQTDLLGRPTFPGNTRTKSHLSKVETNDLSALTESEERIRLVSGNLALSPSPDPANPSALQGNPPGVQISSNTLQGNPSGVQISSSTLQANSSGVQVSSNTLQANPSAGPANVHMQEQSTETKNPIIWHLDHITASWEDFLNKLQGKLGSMIFFTLQRTRPIGLDNESIILECSDHFTADILREQQRRICEIAREFFGHPVRFESRLAEGTRRTDTIHNPYDHFLKLQKKDPLLRQIVELLGAELIY